MEPYLWLNGRLLPLSGASISPLDHGLTAGDGVFETLISYSGHPFALTRHWRRLVHSGEMLGLKVPGRDDLERAILATLAANERTEARIRVTVTGGPAPPGSDKGTAGETILITVADLPQRPALAKVVTVPYCRNEHGALTGAKSTSYGENVAALAYAKLHGAQEAIFPNTRNELCEGTGSNVFLAKNGRLHTPPLSSGCLAGVTRSVVLDLSGQLGLAVAESPMPLTALLEADEAFLTSTFREVQPIAEVDGHRMPLCPGPLTSQLRAAFSDFVRREIDPP